MFVAAFAKHMIHRIQGRVAMATTGCVMLLVITLAAATLGGPLPTPLPLFPSDNWWNVDVSDAPIDPASSNFTSFINNGSTRRLHPDFGGEASPASDQIFRAMKRYGLIVADRASDMFVSGAVDAGTTTS